MIVQNLKRHSLLESCKFADGTSDDPKSKDLP